MKKPLRIKPWLMIVMRMSFLQLSLTLLFAGIAVAGPVKAQELLDRRISLQVSQVELRAVLQRISKVADVHFTYNSRAIQADRKLDVNIRNERLETVLNQLLRPLHIQHTLVDGQIILRPVLPSQLPAEPIPATGALPESVDQVINGTVKGETGEGLPGVSVLVKGTNRGTTTDVEGRYQLTVSSANDVLVFSFVGYESQEISLNGRTSVSVTLQPDVKALGEVVVVGYGTQKRASVTAAVASVTSREIQNQVTNNPLNALAGQLAGVSIAQSTGKPGANPVVRVRGTGSISAGNTPLYVVDGMPLQNADDFSMINPSDIESIDVLKDAASAAIYGSRGGNGVVLVTTKKGKTGQSQIEFSYYTGIQQVSKKVAVQNRDEHIDIIKEGAIANWALVGGDPAVPNGQRRYNNQLLNFNYPVSYDNPGSLPDTDWQDLLFQKAPISNYQITGKGGTDKVRYYISGNHFTQDGIIKATDFKRYSFRMNLDATLNPYVRLGMNFSPSYSRENRRQTDGHWSSGDGGLILMALVLPPTITPRYPNGLYGQILGNTEYTQATYSGGIYSPLPFLDDPSYKDVEERARMLGTTYAELEPVKGLVFRSSLGLDFRNYWNNYYRPSTVSFGASAVLTPGQPNPNTANIASRHSEFRTINYAWENTVTYQKRLADAHDFTFLAGYSVQKNTDESSQTTGQSGRFDNDLVTYVTGASIINGTGNKEQWSLLSYLGRLNYAYKDKYLLSAAVRSDGSSRFASNNKWVVFPSASFGWRISEESFLKEVKFLSEAKLRVSYGVTGNFNIGNYRSQAVLSKDNYNFGLGDGTLATGYAPGNFANPNLTWETNTQTDIGLDVGFFQNRLNLSLDYYQRLTEGLLYQRPVPGVSGYTSVFGNIGKIENKGFELAINSVNTMGEFRWTTSLNLSLNRNKVLKLGDKDEPIRVVGENTVTQITQVGRPFADFYGYAIDGIFRNQADVDANPSQKFTPTARPGDTKFVDTNGDGVITPDDRTILGNPQPKFTYGFSNRFAWKGFDLDLQFQGVQGGKVLFLASRFIGYNNLATNNLKEFANNRWRSESDPGNGIQPRVRTAATSAPGLTESLVARYLQDGTYLRLRNVTLGYTVPTPLTKKVRLSSVRVYVTGQNLLTFSNYIGYNPEVSWQAASQGDTVTQPGLDYGVYPLARTVIFGINFGI